MLEHAEVAHQVLENRLQEARKDDGVEFGMAVDIWVEELGTNVSGTVTNIGVSRTRVP